MRLTLNTAYAYLVEQAVAEDAAAVPAYQAAGVKPKEIEASLRRKALDDWLNAALGDEAEYEAAVVDFLKS